MTKWEYLRVRVQYTDRMNHSLRRVTANKDVVYDANQKKEQDFWLYEYLNDLGNQGWELVSSSVSGYMAPPIEFLYLKRSLPE